MISRFSVVGGLFLIIAGLTQAARGQDFPADLPETELAKIDVKLAAQGKAVLEKYCYRCHGVDFKKPGLDVFDRATLIRPKDSKEDPYLVPGDPDKSRLWEVVDTSYMPPEKQPQPTDDEKQLLRRWIEAGANFPPADRPKREFVGEETILAIIADDLESQPAADRRFARYFSLTHLWNDPRVSDELMRVYRAGLSKLLNSLSGQFRIHRPRSVDKEATVLAIDLRDLGWTAADHWNPLLAEYPYGLVRGGMIAERVYELTDCELPYLRADWFIRNAARPPLYHTLLDLPTNAAVLEERLGVDVLSNFEQDRLWRGGFSKSGVSAQNRLVERHDAKHGAYWKSYDFGSNLDRANLFRFPLGPTFAGQKNLAAFDHDGGEIIFHLPNGLQAYLLIKNDDSRIDEGPQDIVNDPNQFGGTFAIVNGISCMGCHKAGMLQFSDTVRASFKNAGAGRTAEKVLRLYPAKDVMDGLVEADAERFQKALESATGPLLRTGKDDKRKLTAFPEPVTKAARAYDQALSIEDVARELGLPGDMAKAQELGVPAAGELATVIRISDVMRRLNLAPLAVGESVPRDVWEQAFGRVARELKLGLPIDFD